MKKRQWTQETLERQNRAVDIFLLCNTTLNEILEDFSDDTHDANVKNNNAETIQNIFDVESTIEKQFDFLWSK